MRGPRIYREEFVKLKGKYMDVNGIAAIVGFIAIVFLCGWALFRLLDNGN